MDSEKTCPPGKQSYMNQCCIYLETADLRIYGEPYGPYCPEAIGRVFRQEPICNGEFTATNISYVKSIVPTLYHPADSKIGELIPINVYGDVAIDEERVLFAKAEFPSPPVKFWHFDDRKRNDMWLIITLFPDTKPASSK